MMKPLPGVLTRRSLLRSLGVGAASLGLAAVLRPTSVHAQPAAKPAPAAPPTPTGPYALPALGYAYASLEPALDARTMEIHHSRHHLAYVNNANQALAAHPELARLGPEEMLRSMARVPGSIAIAIRNNVGGHANHALFWDILTPGGAKEPKGPLAGQINTDFGNRDTMLRELANACASRFGSGWGWLAVYNKKLFVLSTANQDSPLMDGYTPILGIDVWEHAYYLQYQNRRTEYVSAVLGQINWDKVGARHAAALRG